MIIERQRLRENFSKAAAEYDARAERQHRENRRVLDAALKVWPQAATIADIGCGTGLFAKEGKPQRPHWNVIGIDLSEGMAAIAKERCPVLVGDASRLPLASGSLDGVVSSLCYQWVDTPLAAYGELARVLRQGGRAVVSLLGEKTLKELRVVAAQVDLPLMLLPLQGFEANAAAMTGAGLSIIHSERRVTTEHDASLRALLDSMRRIGAGNNFVPEKRQNIGPKRWKAMEALYETLRGEYGLPATWEHHFFILGKA